MRVYVIKEKLGHEDLKTKQIYSQSQKENLENVKNLL
jgi:site-specific recombinase XerD